MLCYRCGSHVPDSSEKCENCGQQLVAGSARRASNAFQRRRAAQVEGAPYRPGDLIAGRYEVKETAGAGPVGFVFRARDRELDVEVAVKVVNARLVQTLEERESFARTIRMGRKLSHQNLARVNEDGEERGFPFYTTPYLDGLSLRKIMDLRQSKGQVFTLQEVEPILGQIASGLTGAHKVGPHANLKPENIIVLPDLLKITDFGLGVALPRAPFVQAQRTRKVEAYFAPEFIKGIRPDPRSDVYALGVILGEMLTGLVPDEAEPVPELLRHRSELPPGVEGVYRRALNENPQARFQTPAELFQEFCALLPARGRSEPPAPPVPEEARRASPAQLRRGAERTPGPPVPASPKAARVEAAPVDATQPLDASMLPFALGDAPRPDQRASGAVPVDATQPLDASMLPFALASEAPAPKPAPAAGVPLDAPGAPTASLRAPRGTPHTTQPLDRTHLPALSANMDNAPTQAMDSSALPSPVGEAAPAPSRSNAMTWLVLLTVAAAVVGAIGGYGLLEWSRSRAARALPVEPPEAGQGTMARGCPTGMVLIPAGAFKMGTAPDDDMGGQGLDERPLASVEMPAFCVDVYEYPNQEGALPKADVTWDEAKELCEKRGRRLCTEQEWEKACKGPANTRFPYGDAFDPDACNTEDAAREERELANSGRFSRCRSGYGVMDLSGNLAEWTSTRYADDADMTQKGGATDRRKHATRCSARRSAAPGARSAQAGFRCCLDAPR